MDDRSLGFAKSETADNGYRALQILREHYAGCSKPRIITLYHQFTTLKNKEGENVTDFIITAESVATVLKAANENVSDVLLVAIVRGGSRAAATSKMERFVITVNGWRSLTIITKSSILDVAAVLDPSLMVLKGLPEEYTYKLYSSS